MYQKVLTEDPPSLLDVVPDAPSELNTIIQLCLRKDAAERFQTVAELATALRSLVRPPVVQREPRGIRRDADRRRPYAAFRSVAVGQTRSVATVTLLAAASVAFWQLQIRGAEHPTARTLHPALSAAVRTSAASLPSPSRSMSQRRLRAPWQSCRKQGLRRRQRKLRRGPLASGPLPPESPALSARAHATGSRRARRSGGAKPHRFLVG